MFFSNNRLWIYLALAALIVTFSGCPATENSAVSPPAGKNDKNAPESRGEYPAAPRAISDTELKSLDGEDFKISDYKGSVVLINLWATWCAPCIEEMPHFIKLQEKYGDDGFVMVGLNSDEETEAQVKKFVEQQNLNYKIGWATDEVAQEFMKISKLPGIPQSLLLNRDGEMTGMFRGGGANVIEKMVESVDKLMAEEQ